jgi:cytidylate kinase
MSSARQRCGADGTTKPVIAIDGPAGAGKSTLAESLASRLGLDRLDTGAMYRAVAYAVLRDGVDPSDAKSVAQVARRTQIEVGPKVTVDGVDASREIRGAEVTGVVSAVAANPEVRRELVRRQRDWVGAHRGGVIEGRDIATVVLPDADLKIFVTASESERARRRALQAEAISHGHDAGAVAADLARRDHLDSTRESSPLAVAEEAVIVDTTGRSVEDIVEELLGRVINL